MKTTFLIVLTEEDDGRVTVKGEAVGTGLNAYELGIEIMANLKAAETVHPERLNVMALEYSEMWH